MDTTKPIQTFLGPDEIGKWIAAQNWATTTIICHNAQFDAFVLSNHYQAFPARIICTMSMARALYGPTQSASLDALAGKFGRPAKTVPYKKFIGKDWATISLDHELRNELAEGCRHDVELTEFLAEETLRQFSDDELLVIDLTARMATEPVLIGNTAKLRSIVEAEESRKAAAIAALGVTRADLLSNTKFAALLAECGETVPTKPGKAANKPDEEG